MEFIDLGRKPNSTKEMVSPSTPYYPSLHIDKKNDYITKKDVGKVITATVKLKVKSHEERIDEKGKETYSCSFDVMSIAFNKGKVTTEKMKSMSSSDLDDLESQEYERLKSLGKGGKK